MKDTGVSKLAALNMLFDKYQSQRHLEEAVLIRTVINREQEYYGHGFQHDISFVVLMPLMSSKKMENTKSL
jgi:hypothetical protein